MVPVLCFPLAWTNLFVTVCARPCLPFPSFFWEGGPRMKKCHKTQNHARAPNSAVHDGGHTVMADFGQSDFGQPSLAKPTSTCALPKKNVSLGGSGVDLPECQRPATPSPKKKTLTFLCLCACPGVVLDIREGQRRAQPQTDMLLGGRGSPRGCS